MKRHLNALFPLVLSLILPIHSAHSGGALKISSGTSAMSSVFSRVPAPFEKATGIKIVLIQKDPKGVGSDVVFQDVDQGRAEAGATGAHWEGLLSMLTEKNLKPQSKLSEFKNRVIARDLVRIYTFKGGPASLTEDQIKSIFKGTIRNWKEVGGPDQEILFIRSAKLPATEKFLFDRVLKLDQKEGSPGIKKTVKLGTEVEISQYLHKIATTPGAFGIGPSNETQEANAPKIPDFGRPITLFWKGAPSANLMKFLKFMETEGKKYAPN